MSLCIKGNELVALQEYRVWCRVRSWVKGLCYYYYGVVLLLRCRGLSGHRFARPQRFSWLWNRPQKGTTSNEWQNFQLRYSDKVHLGNLAKNAKICSVSCAEKHFSKILIFKCIPNFCKLELKKIIHIFWLAQTLLYFDRVHNKDSIALLGSKNSIAWLWDLTTFFRRPSVLLQKKELDWIHFGIAYTLFPQDNHVMKTGRPRNVIIRPLHRKPSVWGHGLSSHFHANNFEEFRLFSRHIRCHLAPPSFQLWLFSRFPIHD